MHLGKGVVSFLLVVSSFSVAAEPLYTKPAGAKTRWSSFENMNGAPGQGGQENRGGKGHAFDSLKAGETKVLLDVQGAGSIERMWFTHTGRRDPAMLRALRLDMNWDGASEPAVSVPFGDFFGAILGRPKAFENELFSNPEGRSFNCYIPMPFRTGAKVTISNDSTQDLEKLFFDIDFLRTEHPSDDALYFHAVWTRNPKTALRQDFAILPEVKGSGRFLGAHVGVIGGKDYVGWWGEGEVKMYFDGDRDFATIVGTGTEDYIGTGWGQGVYANRFQGCLVADATNRQYTFYRYHVPDPIYFDASIRVTLQQMGGASKREVVGMLDKGVEILPVSVDTDDGFDMLLDKDPPVDVRKHPSWDSAWVNYFRRDDMSAVALFYLDRPTNGLPPIPPVEARTEALLTELEDGK